MINHPNRRSQITLTDTNEVTLRTDDETRVFWIPMSGGYVREGADHSGSNPQVCKCLNRHGATLSARDGDELLSVIRREWKRARSAA